MAPTAEPGLGWAATGINDVSLSIYVCREVYVGDVRDVGDVEDVEDVGGTRVAG